MNFNNSNLPQTYSRICQNRCRRRHLPCKHSRSPPTYITFSPHFLRTCLEDLAEPYHIGPQRCNLAPNTSFPLVCRRFRNLELSIPSLDTHQRWRVHRSDQSSYCTQRGTRTESSIVKISWTRCLCEKWGLCAQASHRWSMILAVGVRAATQLLLHSSRPVRTVTQEPQHIRSRRRRDADPPHMDHTQRPSGAFLQTGRCPRTSAHAVADDIVTQSEKCRFLYRPAPGLPRIGKGIAANKSASIVE